MQHELADTLNVLHMAESPGDGSEDHEGIYTCIAQDI